ncbi:GNAT family N-acetyltransferase [Bradyrhizobium sp. Cp5.3]|uniref:GNAT family N-acetyltransferase n=1 Tax=Bradyrhizobium sp. Cp5.3 TaxID=443598 RepID=UPI000480EA9B|nr:GNAT family N-acetyltransferase [Bradyrhizobium sp. Cp5.3]
MTFLSVEQLDGRVSSTAGIAVDFVRDWSQAILRLSAGHRTAFQHGYWLGAWYEAFHDFAPLIAVISDAATGRAIAVVPMVCRTGGGIRIVEFADLGVSDNNAPILALDAPLDPAGARAVGEALVKGVRALPERFDLLRLKKMPAYVGRKPNPLVTLGRVGSCSLNGNLVLAGDDYADYQASIKRMQMPRCWRVFSRHAGARFEIAANLDRARELLDVMDVQQQDRMNQLGSKFVLNDDAHARFYRDVARRGVAEGYTVVSALVCDEGIVATTLGVRYGATYVLLRISHAGKNWSNCSPGLLVTERTMEALHAQGVRRFDLSIGNHDYKRRFGAVPVPLTDVSVALSWRGWPYVLRDHTAQGLRRHPRLAAFAAWAMGRSYP